MTIQEYVDKTDTTSLLRAIEAKHDLGTILDYVHLRKMEDKEL